MKKAPSVISWAVTAVVLLSVLGCGKENSAQGGREYYSEINWAVRNGDFQKVKALLADDPQLVSSRSDNYTPLHYAAAYKRKEIAELLLAYDADVNAKGDQGKTPLLSCVWLTGGHAGERSPPPSPHSHADLVNLLLKAGADTDAETSYGHTTLTLAAQNGAKQVVEVLLAAGVDTEAAWNLERGTALTVAATEGHADIVELLLAAGADMEARDRIRHYWSDSNLNINLATPLIHAAAEGHLDVVKLLLDAGANYKAEDAWGQTALDVAARKEHHEVVELLRAQTNSE